MMNAAEIAKIKSYATLEAEREAEPYCATIITKSNVGVCEFFREYKVASKWYRKQRTSAGFQCGMLCVFMGGKWRIIRSDEDR